MANFSPVSGAAILVRLPEQIFLKRRLRLHEEFQAGLKFQTKSETGLEISARLNGLKKLM